MLTRKQHDLLVYIHSQIREHGIPPTFGDMAAAMGLKSKSGVYALIDRLEDRGFIRRLPRRRQAIEVFPVGADGQPIGPRTLAQRASARAATFAIAQQAFIAALHRPIPRTLRRAHLVGLKPHSYQPSANPADPFAGGGRPPDSVGEGSHSEVRP